MPFGKYRGQPLADIPTQYLNWCIDNIDEMDDDLRDAIEEEVGERTPRHSRKSTRAHTPPTSRGRLPPAEVKREYLRDLVSAGRKALARKYHPDTGGDLRVMQSVNASADWLENLVEQAMGASR